MVMKLQMPDFGSLEMNAAKHITERKIDDATEKKSFQSLILDAADKMNNQQLDVVKMERQLVTDPDSVNVHEITAAMAKAQMSLSLAQTVIDRVITGWNEISTTR